MRKVWIRHLLIGIPVAAFLHSLLQFLYDPILQWTDWFLLPLHILSGIIVGALTILGIAYTIQALLSLALHRMRASLMIQILAGGTLQAIIVWVWSLVVGIEPSLSGRFLLTPPMIVAGFLSGCIVSVFAAPRFPAAK